jgi:hypothetical protein
MTENWEEFLKGIPEKWAEFARKTKAEFNKEMDWVRAEEMTIGIIGLNISQEKDTLNDVEKAIAIYNGYTGKLVVSNIPHSKVL